MMRRSLLSMNHVPWIPSIYTIVPWQVSTSTLSSAALTPRPTVLQGSRHDHHILSTVDNECLIADHQAPSSNLIMLRSRVNLPLGRRRCFSTSLQARHAVRFHRSDFEGYDRHVAVIGGGITGLTTAYRLSENPRTHVTLYEKSSRLGGWLQSEYLDVDGKRILFEYGPRTFRMGFPGAVATIELVGMNTIATPLPLAR